MLYLYSYLCREIFDSLVPPFIHQILVLRDSTERVQLALVEQLSIRPSFNRYFIRGNTSTDGKLKLRREPIRKAYRV